MESKASTNFSGYFLLFAALIFIVAGDFMSFISHNSLVGNFLVWSGIVVAIFGIFTLVD